MTSFDHKNYRVPARVLDPSSPSHLPFSYEKHDLALGSNLEKFSKIEERSEQLSQSAKKLSAANVELMQRLDVFFEKLGVKNFEFTRDEELQKFRSSVELHSPEDCPMLAFFKSCQDNSRMTKSELSATPTKNNQLMERDQALALGKDISQVLAGVLGKIQACRNQLATTKEYHRLFRSSEPSNNAGGFNKLLHLINEIPSNDSLHGIIKTLDVVYNVLAVRLSPPKLTGGARAVAERKGFQSKDLASLSATEVGMRVIETLEPCTEVLLLDPQAKTNSFINMLGSLGVINEELETYFARQSFSNLLLDPMRKLKLTTERSAYLFEYSLVASTHNDKTQLNLAEYITLRAKDNLSLRDQAMINFLESELKETGFAKIKSVLEEMQPRNVDTNGQEINIYRLAETQDEVEVFPLTTELLAELFPVQSARETYLSQQKAAAQKNQQYLNDLLAELASKHELPQEVLPRISHSDQIAQIEDRLNCLNGISGLDSNKIAAILKLQPELLTDEDLLLTTGDHLASQTMQSVLSQLPSKMGADESDVLEAILRPGHEKQLQHQLNFARTLAIVEGDYPVCYKIVTEILKHCDLSGKFTPEILLGQLKQKRSTICLPEISYALSEMSTHGALTPTSFRKQDAYELRGYTGSLNALHEFMTSYKAKRAL